MAQQLSSVNVSLTANNVDYIRKLVAAKNETTKTTTSMKKDYGDMNKKVKTVAQGMGYQMQDIAVQAQQGTDKMVILAQQGPQILSLLGPMGALAGAALAVAAALGSAFFAGADAGDQFEHLTAKTTQLTDAQRGLLEKLLEEKKLPMVEKIDDLNESIGESQKKLTMIESGVFGKTFGVKSREIDFLKSKIAELVAERDTYIQQQESLEDKVAVKLDPTIKDAREASESFNEMTLSLSQEMTALQLTGKEQEVYRASLRLGKGATKEQIEVIRVLTGQIYEQKKAVEAQAEADRKKKAETEKAERLETRRVDKLKKYVSTLNHELSLTRLNSEEQFKANEIRKLGIDLNKSEQVELDKLIHKKWLMVEAEREQLKAQQRDARLSGLETSFMDDSEKELQKHRETSELLMQEKSTLHEWEYAERARINNLLELEQQRHEDRMGNIKRQEAISAMELDQVRLQGAAQISGQLQSLFEEDSDAAKALFLVNKGIAFAESIVSAELGAAKALEMGPVGIPLSNTIRALGYMNAGIIAGTAVGQFHGGGVVPEGYDNQSFLLKAGERVLTPDQNQKFEMLEQGAKSGGNGDVSISAPVTINGNVTDKKWFGEELQKHRNLIAASVKRVERERPLSARR